MMRARKIHWGKSVTGTLCATLLLVGLSACSADATGLTQGRSESTSKSDGDARHGEISSETVKGGSVADGHQGNDAKNGSSKASDDASTMQATGSTSSRPSDAGTSNASGSSAESTTASGGSGCCHDE